MSAVRTERGSRVVSGENDNLVKLTNDSDGKDFEGYQWRRWVQFRQEWKSYLTIVDHKIAYVSRKLFAALDEYSTTLPTGTYYRKLWKRHLWKPIKPGGCPAKGRDTWDWIDKWALGEYMPAEDKNRVLIRWREITIVD